ncbi:hypothetical protein L218DRAFT_228680 [Marasmius fiardii PR-910]|nr:hypothetical protein L218DRAFT_228680 [Marasmius fiardii PR-910]
MDLQTRRSVAFQPIRFHPYSRTFIRLKDQDVPVCSRIYWTASSYLFATQYEPRIEDDSLLYLAFDASRNLEYKFGFLRLILHTQIPRLSTQIPTVELLEDENHLNDYDAGELGLWVRSSSFSERPLTNLPLGTRTRCFYGDCLASSADACPTAPRRK